MEIREESSGGVLVVAVAGRIDSTTSGDLEKRLLPRLDAGVRRLVVDFTEVQYISSAGLRVLLVLAKRLQAPAGGLVLCSLGEPVRQVFDLAGFLPLFSLEASREAALARLSTGER